MFFVRIFVLFWPRINTHSHRNRSYEGMNEGRGRERKEGRKEGWMEGRKEGFKRDVRTQDTFSKFETKQHAQQ